MQQTEKLCRSGYRKYYQKEHLFFWQRLRPNHTRSRAKGAEPPPAHNLLGHSERFFVACVLWGFCILLQKEVYTGEVLVQLQLDTGLDQTLIITESQILEMSTDVFTLHSSDPTFHYIKISSCFF